MKIWSSHFLLFALFLGPLTNFSTQCNAQEIELVNRPVNSSGMTGLMVTSIPFTIPSGTVELGVSALSETSAVPDFTISELPLTVTIGLSNTVEMALRGSYLYREEGVDPARKRGAGDSEISLKWNMIPQRTEGGYRPAVSLQMGVMGLTGDRDSDLNRVHNWGATIALLIGREIMWGEHILGIYLDGRITAEDLNRIDVRDRYSALNAGILLPISKMHNLQIVLEYGSIDGKKYTDIDGGDNSTVTYGLRMVTKNFNLTVGNQFIHKDITGYDRSGRVIGTISIKI